MKITTLIPFWADYKPSEDSLFCKPLTKISGKSLISRTIEIANHIDSVSHTAIFTSSDNLPDCIDSNMQYEIVKRDKDLDSNVVSIEDIIERFLKKSDAEVIVLINPKSPFIKPGTIEDCIKKVVTGEFDSAFVVSRIQRHAWYKGKPLNYSMDKDTPQVGKVEPVLIESSSIYVFTRELFETSHHRIGNNPYIKEVGLFEGFEVDNKDDLMMAELIINAGLNKEV